MKSKIFNAQEVQSMISGDKTQFREVIKEIGKVKLNSGCAGLYFGKCPYEVGQKIFCKESFSMSRGLEYHQCHDAWYWADGNPESGDWTKPKPAQHMKQEQSRLTLQIKEIRVERLADISEEDAIAEGVDKLFTEEEMKCIAKAHPTEKNDYYKNYLWHGHIGRTITNKQSDEWCYQYSSYKQARDSFSSLWNATHKKPEEKFEANPWAWCVSFEVINN